MANNSICSHDLDNPQPLGQLFFICPWCKQDVTTELLLKRKIKKKKIQRMDWHRYTICPTVHTDKQD
jgi:hypothetical protein